MQSRKEYLRKCVHRDYMLCFFFITVTEVILSYAYRGIPVRVCIAFAAACILLSPAVIYTDINRRLKTEECSDPLHPNRKLSEKGIYGTAKLEEPWDYRSYAQIRDIEKCVGIILGQLTNDGSQCIDFFQDPQDPAAHINNHIFACGCSGSGKTFTFGKTYCYQAIKRGHSVIHTDPKGELFRDTAHIYRKHGYIVRRINFIFPEKSDGWDCLKTIREETRSEKVEILTQRFADAVISNAIGGDPSSIYYSAPMLLLKALILRLVLDDAIPEDQKNIRKVYEWLTDPGGTDFLDRLFDTTFLPEKVKPCIAPYILYKSSSGNLAGNIRINLGAGIQILGAGLISEILSRDELDLSLPGDVPCAYFIQFPVPNDSYRFPVALFFSMVFQTLTNKAIDSVEGRLRREVDFFLDEFAQCGVLPSWAEYMSVIRSYGINVFMIVQTISQFMERYPKAYNTIISACSTWLMIGANDTESAEYFSERCGRSSFLSQSESRQGLRKVFGIGNRPSERVTEGTGQGSLFNPDEIIKLPPNQTIIMFTKHNPILAYTVAHTVHPYYREMEKVSNENEPDLMDIKAKENRSKREKEYVEKYWQEHNEFIPPDNIRDAPFEKKPSLWNEVYEIILDDFKSWMEKLKKIAIIRRKEENYVKCQRSKIICREKHDVPENYGLLYTASERETDSDEQSNSDRTDILKDLGTCVDELTKLKEIDRYMFISAETSGEKETKKEERMCQQIYENSYEGIGLIPKSKETNSIQKNETTDRKNHISQSPPRKKVDNLYF